MTIGRINPGATNALTQSSTKSNAEKSAEKNTSEHTIKDSVDLDSGKDAKAPKKWTILHYAAGDNNLTPYMVSDVNEMESVGSTANMNLVVQLDKGNRDCKRYYLIKDDNMDEIKSPVLEDMGSTNMASPKELADFIKFGMEKYPAEHYALIISDHGGAWRGAVSDYGHYRDMTTPQIKEGLDLAQKDTGRQIDVLGFDACLMASTEVAYELRDNAKYMVASENNEGADGWPYVPLLTKKNLQNLDGALKQKLDISPEALAKKIVDDASDSWAISTISATDLSKMPNLKDACNSLAKQILKTDTPNEVLRKIAQKTKSFYGYKDLYHFAEQISESKDIKDETLKAYGKLVMTTVKRAVIAEEHSVFKRNIHGLNAEIPDSNKVDWRYPKLQFAKDTQWDEAMNKINEY
ncbi:MAG: hypothetical protein K8T10_17070 [Candidatus Eremiobacteraeota bacterium]|nr:hypothetical protein [Candidatus Eremiobacteraeota bacterium]